MGIVMGNESNEGVGGERGDIYRRGRFVLGSFNMNGFVDKLCISDCLWVVIWYVSLYKGEVVKVVKIIVIDIFDKDCE